jgi:hypothetical protein
MEPQAQPSLARSRIEVIKRLSIKDLIAKIGILQGLESLQNECCSICKMWLGNPLQHLQSLVGGPRRLKPLSLIHSTERWDSGGQLGCTLCHLVSLVSARMRDISTSQNELHMRFDAAQLSVTPTRGDFPHHITVLGLDGDEKRWQVEFYATLGNNTSIIHSHSYHHKRRRNLSAPKSVFGRRAELSPL